LRNHHFCLKYCISLEKVVTRAIKGLITIYMEYHKTERKFSKLVLHQQIDQEQSSSQMEQTVKEPANSIIHSQKTCFIL
jgi:hypothetical protein